MVFYLTADMEFRCTDPARDTDGNFEAFLDAVMESLADLEDVDKGITGGDVTATITRRRAAIDMSIEADSLKDAMRLFMANARTALHAAGCGTPNWPVYKPTCAAGQRLRRRASQPVGRVLCTRLRGPAAIHLRLPLPAASCGLPASIGRAALKRSRGPRPGGRGPS